MQNQDDEFFTEEEEEEEMKAITQPIEDEFWEKFLQTHTDPELLSERECVLLKIAFQTGVCAGNDCALAIIDYAGKKDNETESPQM